MNASRLFLNSMSSIQSVHEIKICRMSSKMSKIVNHYDTLKIARNSNQEDIKSAYYELSKKYHPDRNTSADAKMRFQNVSEAYEVLSNYQKRKMYDRDLSARGDHVTTSGDQASAGSTNVEYKEDPLTGFYRSRMQTHYDFDAWTKAHYGKTLRHSIQGKSSKVLREELQRRREEEIRSNALTSKVLLIISFIVITSLTIQSYIVMDNYDRNLIAQKSINQSQSSKREKQP